MSLCVCPLSLLGNDLVKQLLYVSSSLRPMSYQRKKTINTNVRGTEQGECMHGKYKWFKLGGGKAYDPSSG